jgi:predicted transcriptional regulator
LLNQENNDIVKGIAKDTVNLIKKYPKIILDELLQKFKKSRRTITHLIKKLQEEQIIFCIG